MRRSLRRTIQNRTGLLFLLAIGWSLPLSAQECDELEGDDLTVCLTLMVCMALDEAKARNQCLEVARQVLDQHDAQRDASRQTEQISEEVDATPPDQLVTNEIPNLVEETVQDRQYGEERSTATEPISQSIQTEATTTDESSGGRASRWFSWMRRGNRGSTLEIDEDDPGLTKDGVPKQFAATVVAVAQAGYNDALVVLSNRYVFVVNRARQSRIEPGDVIVARKKEGLSGRLSFLFYGRGASVDAHRVVCDHIEPSRQTKRRCDFATRHLGAEPL